MKQLTEISTPFADIASNTALLGDDLAWLKQLREQAKAIYLRQGLPAKKQEDWKYTSLWALSQQQFSHSPQPISLSAEAVAEKALLADAYRIVIVDGVFSAELSQLANIETGLTVAPLSDAIEQAQPYLAKQADLAKPGLNALNTMLLNEGVFIHVAADAKIDKPVELLVINSGETDNLAVHLRNVVVLDQGSEASFVEHYVGADNATALTDVVTEVKLAENAELHHYKLQQESKQTFHIATLAATQEASSQWHTHNMSLGAALARNDVQSRLLGEQSHVTMNGLYLVDGKQHVDNHTRIDHAVPNTTSEELYKGVLSDNSRAVFNGKVIVHKDAQKTDANQANHNLLLSRGCEIDTKPEMEIYADDVKCGHGSTVGQIDEDQLFFLRARGLNETSARSLLTFAFAAEVLERLPSASIREAMSAVLEQRLPRGVEAV